MSKLIMLPYAGSLIDAYSVWRKFSDKEIDIVSISYNGRGGRSDYSYPRNWNELIKETYEQIKEISCDNDEYILLGHSMGAKVALDIYYLMIENCYKLPKSLIFSGTITFDKKKKNLLEMSNDEFERYFIDIGGISEEVLKEEELKEMVFEALKEDISLLNQFEYRAMEDKIKCPVMVLNGSDDLKCLEDEWNILFRKSCIYREFKGNHFFIINQKEEVFSYLKEVIFQ